MSIVASGETCPRPPQKYSMVTVGITGEGPASGHASETPVSHRRIYNGCGGNLPASTLYSSGKIPLLFPVSSVKTTRKR